MNDSQKFAKLLRTIVNTEIRKVIKEELADILREGLQSTISEMKMSNTKKADKKMYKNSSFSDILNETKFNDVTSNSKIDSYRTMMNNVYTTNDVQAVNLHDSETNSNMQIPDTVSKALTKDYSALMKAIDQKNKERRS
jgi:Ca2+-binding RTX toxin-like protein